MTHPQILMEPHKLVPDWSLNDIGRMRIADLVQSRALEGTAKIISSAETKALESAEPIANDLDCALEIRPNMHENDRSSTGFLPPDEFESVANEFFAHPTRSIRGWERAVDAQTRIVAEYKDIVQQHIDGDILFVGHGGVGTLLLCHLNGYEIDRQYDQPSGGGNYFEWSCDHSIDKLFWQPMENLFQGLA